MGKREVRMVIVPKWITAALLILISAAMIALVAALSGRAYATATLSLRELFANALLFVPWGFLAFMLFDRKKRSRSYVVTLIVGIVFAAGLALWQSLLPARVMTIADSFANIGGTFTGAALAHLRKGVRVRFDC